MVLGVTYKYYLAAAPDTNGLPCKNTSYVEESTDFVYHCA